MNCLDLISPKLYIDLLLFRVIITNLILIYIALHERNFHIV